MARVVHVNEQFDRQTIYLRGHRFENCRFNDCILVVAAGHSDLIDCTMTDCHWRLEGVVLPVESRSAEMVRSICDYALKCIHISGESCMALIEEISRQVGGRVYSGPFAGMIYGPGSINSAFPPQLLGLYEKELWPIIEEIIRRDYRKLINLGAGEGYYSVGLAMRMPAAQVVSYEIELPSREAMRQTADRNGVAPRIQILGQCTAALLAAQLDGRQRTLVLCDVEGAEEELLDREAIPRLSETDILVELHDYEKPGIGERFRRRFGATHVITEIPSVERSPEEWPAGIKMGVQLRLTALNEFRPWPMEWFWMESRRPNAGSGS
jgi:hypothetical protein